MAPYATPDELALSMGVLDGWESAQAARALQLLEDATGVIDDELHHPITWSMDTVTLDGTGTSKLLLPRWPVTSVTAVYLIDVDGTETLLTHGVDYTWSDKGILTRRSGCWPCRDRCVRVVYTAGYATTPANVGRICRRLAAAGWNNPAGADSEQFGDRTVKWHTPGMELTTAEKDTLSSYGVR